MLEIEPILLSLKLAFLTTLILFLIGVPLAYWLHFSKSKWKMIVEALVTLPLVLPPTVLGFYLLISFSPESFIGKFFLSHFHLSLAFSFIGILIGSIFYSLPFMVQSLQSGFTQIPQKYVDYATLLGKNKWQLITKVYLPLMKKSITTGLLLTFAHTVGEFGVVLMIGGNIPNKTKVLSITIFDQVEKMNYSVAHIYSAGLLIIMFIALLLLAQLKKQKHA
jgi:molybdate transport system permease protein